MIYIGKEHTFTLQDFKEVVFERKKLALLPDALTRLDKTRRFIDYLLENNIKVYGLTTGFADLRNCPVSPNDAALLSNNIIESHDAGIGPSLPKDVILGAMVTRAVSLAKGHSGFQSESLITLLDMINHEIVPFVPATGSLGASGDLAFLARVGRAMRGDDVPVWFQGDVMSAKEALKLANIRPFIPKAKEGLAMTNGTSFMISMMAIAYLKEINAFENILAMQGFFLNAVGAVDAAFNACIHEVRKQEGQSEIAKILSSYLKDSPFIDFMGIQDDYCIRCLPQIFGPKLEAILAQKLKIEGELDAVTDNPLLFKDYEISDDVYKERMIFFEGENWVVLSGGNFHGECITSMADTIAAANAKIAFTMERQITYMLNPFRNKNRLPAYLVSKTGLSSGYMITQYTANGLTQKIAKLASPTSTFNITSANESEDVVSYGATAAQRLLEQIERLEELNAIYLTVSFQAYSIARKKLSSSKQIPPHLLTERLFLIIQEITGEEYPIEREENFQKRYSEMRTILNSGLKQKLAKSPSEILY